MKVNLHRVLEVSKRVMVRSEMHYLTFFGTPMNTENSFMDIFNRE